MLQSMHSVSSNS